MGALVDASASQSRDPPVPLVNVIVTLAPAGTLVALTVRFGAVLIVNVSGPESPPPGAGVKTVTAAVPSVAQSLAGIDARNCVLLTKVVVRFAPFQRTTDVDTNPLPLTVSVNAELPTGVLTGESDVSTGAGAGGAFTETVGLVAARV